MVLLDFDEAEVVRDTPRLWRGEGGEALLQVSRNSGMNLLNVHYVSDIVKSLTIVSHIPQEINSGMGIPVQWEVISTSTAERDEGSKTGHRTWSDDAVSTEASAILPSGSL